MATCGETEMEGTGGAEKKEEGRTNYNSETRGKGVCTRDEGAKEGPRSLLRRCNKRVKAKLPGKAHVSGLMGGTRAYVRSWRPLSLVSVTLLAALSNSLSGHCWSTKTPVRQKQLYWHTLHKAAMQPGSRETLFIKY